MRISRIYNNNVVLTVDHLGKESVMIVAALPLVSVRVS